MAPPKIGHKLMRRNNNFPEQTWRRNGSCPEGTIPIRKKKPTSIHDEIANRTIFFFSYTAHPSDDKIITKDEGIGKIEVSGRL